MLFFAASKGNYFQWTQLEHDVAMGALREDKYGGTW